MNAARMDRRTRLCIPETRITESAVASWLQRISAKNSDWGNMLKVSVMTLIVSSGFQHVIASPSSNKCIIFRESLASYNEVIMGIQ